LDILRKRRTKLKVPGGMRWNLFHSILCLEGANHHPIIVYMITSYSYNIFFLNYHSLFFFFVTRIIILFNRKEPSFLSKKKKKKRRKETSCMIALVSGKHRKVHIIKGTQLIEIWHSFTFAKQLILISNIQILYSISCRKLF
jgi:hypothetical protein